MSSSSAPGSPALGASAPSGAAEAALAATSDAVNELETSLRETKLQLAHALEAQDELRMSVRRHARAVDAALEQLTLIQQALDSKLIRKGVTRSMALSGGDRARRAAADALLQRNRVVTRALTHVLAGVAPPEGDSLESHVLSGEVKSIIASAYSKRVARTPPALGSLLGTVMHGLTGSRSGAVVMTSPVGGEGEEEATDEEDEVEQRRGLVSATPRGVKAQAAAVVEVVKEGRLTSEQALRRMTRTAVPSGAPASGRVCRDTRLLASIHCFLDSPARAAAACVCRTWRALPLRSDYTLWRAMSSRAVITPDTRTQLWPAIVHTASVCAPSHACVWDADLISRLCAWLAFPALTAAERDPVATVYSFAEEESHSGAWMPARRLHGRTLLKLFSLIAPSARGVIAVDDIAAAAASMCVTSPCAHACLHALGAALGRDALASTWATLGFHTAPPPPHSGPHVPKHVCVPRRAHTHTLRFTHVPPPVHTRIGPSDAEAAEMRAYSRMHAVLSSTTQTFRGSSLWDPAPSVSSHDATASPSSTSSPRAPASVFDRYYTCAVGVARAHMCVTRVRSCATRVRNLRDVYTATLAQVRSAAETGAPLTSEVCVTHARAAEDVETAEAALIEACMAACEATDDATAACQTADDALIAEVMAQRHAYTYDVLAAYAHAACRAADGEAALSRTLTHPETGVAIPTHTHTLPPIDNSTYARIQMAASRSAQRAGASPAATHVPTLVHAHVQPFRPLPPRLYLKLIETCLQDVDMEEEAALGLAHVDVFTLIAGSNTQGAVSLAQASAHVVGGTQPLVFDVGTPAEGVSMTPEQVVAGTRQGVCTDDGAWEHVHLPALPAQSQHVLIDADVHRTFGELEMQLKSGAPPQLDHAFSHTHLHPAETSTTLSQQHLDAMRHRLRRVCMAYSMYDRDVGYVQGMNFMCSMMLLHTSSAVAFTGLNALVHGARFAMCEIFGIGLRRVSLCFSQMSTLMERFTPSLSSHLKRLNVSPDMFASAWLMTAFSSLDTLPYPYAVRVWDMFLLDGWKAIMRSVAVLMRAVEGDLTTADFSTAVQYLHTYPESRLPHTAAAFIRKCARLRISNRWLAEVEKVYEEALAPHPDVETVHAHAFSGATTFADIRSPQSELPRQPAASDVTASEHALQSAPPQPPRAHSDVSFAKEEAQEEVEQLGEAAPLSSVEEPQEAADPEMTVDAPPASLAPVSAPPVARAASAPRPARSASDGVTSIYALNDDDDDDDEEEQGQKDNAHEPEADRTAAPPSTSAASAPAPPIVHAQPVVTAAVAPAPAPVTAPAPAAPTAPALATVAAPAPAPPAAPFSPASTAFDDAVLTPRRTVASQSSVDMDMITDAFGNPIGSPSYSQSHGYEGSSATDAYMDTFGDGSTSMAAIRDDVPRRTPAASVGSDVDIDALGELDISDAAAMSGARALRLNAGSVSPTRSLPSSLDATLSQGLRGAATRVPSAGASPAIRASSTGSTDAAPPGLIIGSTQSMEGAVLPSVHVPGAGLLKTVFAHDPLMSADAMDMVAIHAYAPSASGAAAAGGLPGL